MRFKALQQDIFLSRFKHYAAETETSETICKFNQEQKQHKNSTGVDKLHLLF